MKYAALLLLLIIPGVVYAEESIVQVPFDYHGQSCTFNEVAIEYHCVWQGTYSTFTIEDLEEFKGILSEQTYEKELAKLTPIEPTIEPTLTDTEKTIQELEAKLEKGTMLTPDAVLLQMLRTLDECQQGLGNSAAIQQERTFVISDYQYLDIMNVPLDGELGVLAKAVEECKAQHTLENHVISVAYANMVNGANDITYDHYAQFEGVSAIPFTQYTKSDFKVDISVICDGNAYPQSYKDAMGCPPIIYEGFIYPEGSGFISYYSPILEEYTFFMQDYGNREATQKDKMIQANNALPIAKEMIENHLFHQFNKE